MENSKRASRRSKLNDNRNLRGQCSAPNAKQEEARDAPLARLWFRIFRDDALAVLGRLRNEMPRPVDCVVCSPPYFNQRLYGNSDLELGREGTVEAYLDHLADVFDAIPLRRDGSVWVNIADKRRSGELLLIPQRFVATMRPRGWRLVDNVVWAKAVARPYA